MKILRITSLALALNLGGATFAQTVDFTTEHVLPPDLAWSGRSERLLVKATDTWATPWEKNGLTVTPGYDETIGYLKRLAAASPLIRLEIFGQTPQGRDMIVAVVSKDKGLLDPDKPLLLAQSGIHAGEIDGKDAGLMLLRDIAFKGKSRLLDKANFLFVPVFNIDGHERTSEFNRPNQRGPANQGWRSTAQNLNLNRDYAKLDTPEMRAMIGLIRKYKPDMYMDLHVTDGMDYQYDITFGFQGDSGNWAASPATAKWLRDVFKTEGGKALKTMGHTPGPLIFEKDPSDPTAGLVNDGFSPRYSQTYGDIVHMAAVLVENHSLKNYRRRVLGTYVLLEQTLKTLAKHGAALRAAEAADRAARAAEIPVGWDLEEKASKQVEFLPVAYEKFHSDVTGTDQVRWLGKPAKPIIVPLYESVAKIKLARPKAYWVPATKADVIERLKLQGIEMETLDAPKTVSVSMLRLPDAKPAAKPFEGRFNVEAGTPVAEQREVWFPAGSVRVSTDQPLGDLAMILLDPQSEDSFFAWGFFTEILSRVEYAEGYVLAPLGEKMMAADPKLKAEFEAKVAGDEAFAKNPYARLSWFYERTPYAESTYKLYPVGIEK